ITVMRTDLRQPVQFTRWKIIAHPIATVIGEPEIPGLRMPVETHGVAHTMRHDLAIGAIDVHTRDRGEDLILAETDVARRAHRNVEFAIRAEGDEFPAVRCFIGITFDHDLRLRWIIEVILDVLQPYNAI